jgi:tRNA-splicing ligase RtcB
MKQVGTLGGGNHFIELQSDEAGRVWFMVHSGSRNIGRQVCDHYDKAARGYMAGLSDELVQEDLAYLPDDAPEHDDYLAAMQWCCTFAEVSRQRLLEAVESAVRSVVDGGWLVEEAVQTHHNYASLEEHNGEAVLVHRKGAVRAEGPVIIPGSMGTASYIAEGLASEDAFRTCSHGAGRVMGRKQANREISHEEAVKAMEHVVFGVRKGDYEEMPQAYKDIHQVMANQADLVRPTHVLKPLAVVKG